MTDQNPRSTESFSTRRDGAQLVGVLRTGVDHERLGHRAAGGDGNRQRERRQEAPRPASPRCGRWRGTREGAPPRG